MAALAGERCHPERPTNGGPGRQVVDAVRFDVDPEPGQLVLFPSWLAHRALPYDGVAERIVVSFNARVHDARGSDRRHGYAPA